MADVILETKIPSLYVPKVQEMIEMFGDHKISIAIEMFGVEYIFDKRKDGESQIEYAQRFIKEFMVACLKIKELAAYKYRMVEATKDIQEDEVPDGIII